MASVQTQLRPVDTYRDDLESEDFVGKVSKFEFMTHNQSPPTSSADKKRWALFEGMRFPSNHSDVSPQNKAVSSKPPLAPLKSKQGPPTPPKPTLYQSLSSPPLSSNTSSPTKVPLNHSFSVPADNKLPSPVLRSGSPCSIRSCPSPVRNLPSPGIKMSGRLTPNFAPKHSSQEDLRNKETQLEQQCQKMKEARLQDQELEQQEQQRLQDILNMCADYERQLVMEKQQIVQQQQQQQPQQSPKPQPSGIKTNGSLPRDTPPISCSSDSQSPTPNTTTKSFFRSTSSDEEMMSDRLSNDRYDLNSDNRDVTPPMRTGIKTVPSCKAKDMSCDKKNGDVSDTGIFLSLTKSQTLRETNCTDQLKQLKAMKTNSENTISKLKKQVKDMECQESEILTEYEMEKALLEGERQTQLADILDDEKRLEAIRKQEEDIISDKSENQCLKNEDLIDDSKKQLDLLQKNVLETSTKLQQCEESGIDVDEKEELKLFLIRTQEKLEAERKIFEDLEFQKLEYETHREEERETLQHRLNIEKDIINERLKLKRVQLKEIEMQQTTVTELVRSDTSSLECRRQQLLEEFRKEKLKYLAISKRITESIQKNKMNESSESSSPRSSDDETNMDNDDNLNQKLADLRIHRILRTPISHTSDDAIISKVVRDTSLSPIDFGSRSSATLQEVARNRQNILDQQASRVLKEERERVKELKKRVSNEVRTQWEENHRQQRDIQCNSTNSTESEEACSFASVDMPTDTPSSGDETTASECTMLITTPEIHHYDNCQGLINANNMANGSTASSNGNDYSEVVRRREKLRLQRPLTRYLPIRQNNFNLKQHIESAGHQLDMCKDTVFISSHSCRGYLHKLGKKFKSWKKRWFVFDRHRRALMYFRDKSESKARRVIYFQDIEEVYVDHENRVKSPHSRMTFCMKTIDRLFFLMAPSPEAMRMWVDVIFTGAEGYQEFMLDMEL